MLTLFAMPKPFTGHNGTIQRNALESWKQLANIEVILLGNETGVAEAAQEFGFRHLPAVRCNELGTPLVSDLFGVAEQNAKYSVRCYCNADIILPSEFPKAAAATAERFDRFLMIGQRWDVDITTGWNFKTEDWTSDLRNFTMRNGTLHNPAGIDYFCFSAGLWKTIPEFALGRIFWDNWLVQAALESGAALIDATETIFAVHQNHDYNHVVGGREAAWNGEEAQRNKRIGNMGNHLFNVTDATWRLLPLGFTPAVKGIRPQPTVAFDWEKVLSIATSLIESGKPKQALEILEQANPIEPKVEGYFFARAVAQYHLQQLDAAQEMCEQELKRFPEFDPAKQLRMQIRQLTFSEKKKLIELKQPTHSETESNEPAPLPNTTLKAILNAGELRNEIHEKPLVEFSEYTPEYFRGKRVLVIGPGAHRFPTWASAATRLVTLRTSTAPVVADSAPRTSWECVTAPTERMPFTDSSFDFIYLYSPQTLLSDLEKSIAELARITAVHGRILVVNAITTDPNRIAEIWSIQLPTRFDPWFTPMGEYLTTFNESLYTSLEWHIPYFLMKPEPTAAVLVFTMQRSSYRVPMNSDTNGESNNHLDTALQILESNPAQAMRQLQSVIREQTARIVDNENRAPDVTIAMPLYNRSQFVAISLQSALEQNFTGVLEILIVDDGSTDNSLDVVRAFKDSRIRTVSKPHTNAPDTRNRCIVEARAEWIFWLDTDDILLPNALQTLWDTALAKPDVDILCGDTITVDENLQDKGTLHFESWRGRNEEMLRTFLYRNPFPLGNVLMRKSVFDRYGRFDPSFLRGHDMELWSRLALSAVFDNVPVETYIWRHHSGCMSPLTTKFDGSENRSTETRIARRILSQFPLQQLFPELNWSIEYEATLQAWEIAKRLPFISRDPQAIAWCEEQSRIAQKKYRLQQRRFRILHVFSQTTENTDSTPVSSYWSSILEEECKNQVVVEVAILSSSQIADDPANSITLSNGKQIPCQYLSFQSETSEEMFAQILTHFQPDAVHFHGVNTAVESLITLTEEHDCISITDDTGNLQMQKYQIPNREKNKNITCHQSYQRWVSPAKNNEETNRTLPAEPDILRIWQTSGKEASNRPIANPIRFGYFGELTSQAGFTTLIQAALTLQQQQIPISIDLFGSVQNREQIEEIKKIFRAIDPAWLFFRFRGSFPTAKYQELMHDVDIILLPNPVADVTQRVAGEYAIACGMPVVVGCSDNAHLSHWQFPIGDVERLSSTLKRLITEPEAIESDKVNLPPPITPDEFVEQLLDTIDILKPLEAVSTSTRTKSEKQFHTPANVTTIGLFAWDKPAEACGRLRIWDPAFRTKQFRVVSGYNRTDDFSPAQKLVNDTPPQLLYWQRHFVMVADALPEQLRNQMQQWLAQGIPLLYELDDDFETIPATNPNAPFFARFAPAMQKYAGKFTGIIASSVVLANRLSKYERPVFLLKNQLNEKLWNLQSADFDRLSFRRNPDRIVIGWMGTPTHESDIAPLLPVLQELLNQYSNRITLRFFGWLPPQLQGVHNVEFAATMSNDYERFVRAFCAQPFDIGIAPLQNISFNQAKSDIKYLEYAATGAAGIYAKLPGYEESVRNGINGLLCEPSDLPSWKNALVSLIEDRELRSRIAQEAYREVQSTRTLAVTASQWELLWNAVVQNDTSYLKQKAMYYPEDHSQASGNGKRAVSAASHASGEIAKKKSIADPIKICYFSLEPQTNACPQLRVLAPLSRNGFFQIDHAFAHTGFGKDRQVVKKSLDNPDIVLIQRDVVISMSTIPPPLLADFARLKQQGVKFVYELDDHFGAIPDTHPEKRYFFDFDSCMRTYLPWLDAIVVTTEELAEAMRKYHLPIHIFPNQLDENVWRLNEPLPERKQDTLTIGWMGTPTHAADLEPILPALLSLYDKYRERIKFRFFGFLPRSLENHPAMEYQGELVSNYGKFVAKFLATAPDIAIAPLTDIPFNRAKSDIKFLEYAAAGSAGVYVDLPAYRSTVVPSETGLLVKPDDVSGWRNAIEELLIDSELRNRIASHAREYVKSQRTLAKMAVSWEDVYNSLARS